MTDIDSPLAGGARNTFITTRVSRDCGSNGVSGLTR
jgi:hypothetical protein